MEAGKGLTMEKNQYRAGYDGKAYLLPPIIEPIEVRILKRTWASVLWVGIEDAVKYRKIAQSSTTESLAYLDGWTWIMSDSRNFNSFIGICEFLHYDYRGIREQVKNGTVDFQRKLKYQRINR